MELQAKASVKYLKTFYYCKPLKDDKTLCVVCLTCEVEDGMQWDRYQTVCGHVSHSRCFRRWCGTKKCMNCPLRGSIHEIDANKWCFACEVFGHEVASPQCAATYECYGSRSRETLASYEANGIQKRRRTKKTR